MNMVKGISQIIVAVLILMIAITMVGLVYVWANEIGFNFYPGEEIQTNYDRSRACISLESMNKSSGEIIIKNCGKIVLTGIDIYIDGQLKYTDNEIKIEPQKYGIITIVPLEGAKIIIASDLAETPVMTVSN